MRRYKVVNRPAKDPITKQIIQPGGVLIVPAELYDIYKNADVLGEEIIETAMVAPEVETATKPASKIPKHVGGGWYELPDGERVQGKENALKALGGGD